MQLRYYQEEAKSLVLDAWDSGINKTLLSMATGCHAPGQDIMLANGEIKKAEDIKTGDRLLGPDSKARTVLKIHSGISTMRKIIPIKGEPFTVTHDHMLTLVQTNKSSRRKFACDFLGGTLIDTTVSEWEQWSKTQKHIHKIIRTKCDFPDAYKFQLPLDPYVLGVLLGDGSFRTNLSLTTEDSEICEAVNVEIKKFNLCLKKGEADCGKATSWLIKPIDKGIHDAMRFRREILRPLNLDQTKSGNKFIPQLYKTSSYQNRFSILAGLMDTDGSATCGGYDYISKSKQLADDVAFVARSVGLAAYVKSSYKTCQTGSNGIYWRVSITGNTANIPCKVPHKKQEIRQQKKDVLRTGFRVEDAGVGQYFGFTVDGDNRYLMGDFTVTHNCGKTIVFSAIANELVKKGYRVLILAHREELLQQAADKIFAVTGLVCAVEKAEFTAEDSWYRITVGSVQTLMSAKRQSRFDQDHYDFIIVDEAHHCLANSYRKIFAHFGNAKVLGVTATPDRGDMRNLGEFFESLAYEYPLPLAIRDGFLAPIRVQTIPLKIDLNSVSQQAGDFKAGDLSDALGPYLDAIAKEMAIHCRDRKTVVFLPLIATSQKFCEILNSYGFRAAEVNCESDNRKEIQHDFETDRYNVLCNSMLLCLDMATEILTDKGFVHYQAMTLDHKIANWNMDGTVFFERPKEIVCRKLADSEHMVSIQSRTINLRVTNTHRMVVHNKEGGKGITKIAAQNLRAGHVLPACGIAEPMNIKTIQPLWPAITKKHISATAYNLRQSGKYTNEQAYTEARRRKEEHNQLQYKQPNELSIDECRLIGFWIADGSRSRLQGGGVEYILCQSPTYPSIIKWIDDLLARMNFNIVRKERKNNVPCVLWSLSRGTGSGCQQRKGVFCIEPYLEKNGTELFWGLNEKQFDALVEGYWYGDGHHGKAENGMPKSIMMNDTKYDWINLLCTIGSVRGWRCNMIYRPTKNPKHKDQWYLRMIKGQDLHISNKTPIIHEEYYPEKVWCVRTTSKNIITRRYGHVTVMGNTEGWDCPSVSCIVNLRATRIRSLYAQICGRGTRLFPGKENLLLLDFLWHVDKHSLCHPANLICDNQDLADKVTEILAREENADGCDLEATVIGGQSEVVEERERLLAEKLAAQKGRQRALVDPMQFEMSIKAEDLESYSPVFSWEMAPPSAAQIAKLEKAGIFPDEVANAGMAAKLIDRVQARRDQGLTTPKQIRCLEKYGFQHVGTWELESAKKLIDRIAANRWRMPDGLNPKQYIPVKIEQAPF